MDFSKLLHGFADVWPLDSWPSISQPESADLGSFHILLQSAVDKKLLSERSRSGDPPYSVTYPTVRERPAITWNSYQLTLYSFFFVHFKPKRAKAQTKCHLLFDKPELEGASKPALFLTGEGESDDDEGAIDKPCCISPAVACGTTVLLTVFAVWHCVCFNVVRNDSVWCASPARTVVATDGIASHILSAIPLLGRWLRHPASSSGLDSRNPSLRLPTVNCTHL